MKTEEGWEMYIDIKRLKQKGFSNVKIAAMLGISRPTVIKYAGMSVDEFDKEMLSQQFRAKKPDIFREEILTWLKQYPSMTSAQVYDWLEEKYHKINFNESTLRSYVRTMREDHNILKVPVIRQYEAVDDPPMGKQMQVDFGMKKAIRADGNEVTLYVMCFVLSHSRYKYCQWQSRPFNTADIVQIHENAFEYFGGYPEEAVYDQDHLILVSENHGELIYTKDFAAYLQKRRFKVYMCRKADPESKGRVEKVVDFVKDNFASNRTFYSIDRWNEDCLKWLKRRANGKTHATTRKIPAEVFAHERKHLQPAADKIISKTPAISITYQVRKDNTVPIQGNRYTVPRGTYKGPNTYVGVKKIDNQYIIIYELESGHELAQFQIPETKGNLVSNNNHKRDKRDKISRMVSGMVARFSNAEMVTLFLEEIHKEKPRYMRDQLQLMDTAMQAQDQACIDKALTYCVQNRLFNAVDFRDAVKHYSKITHSTAANGEAVTFAGLCESSVEKISTKAQVRDICEYIKIMNGNTGG